MATTKLTYTSINKRKFNCAYKIASQSSPNNNLRIHIDKCSRPGNYGCEIIQRITDIRYLDIKLDVILNFDKCLLTLASRTRKIIGIMKALRDPGNPAILKQVYFAICLSNITYSLH